MSLLNLKKYEDKCGTTRVNLPYSGTKILRDDFETVLKVIEYLKQNQDNENSDFRELLSLIFYTIDYDGFMQKEGKTLQFKHFSALCTEIIKFYVEQVLGSGSEQSGSEPKKF